MLLVLASDLVHTLAVGTQRHVILGATKEEGRGVGSNGVLCRVVVALEQGDNGGEVRRRDCPCEGVSDVRCLGVHTIKPRRLFDDKDVLGDFGRHVNKLRLSGVV